jgi:cation diffusion facilitator CzcD-associated flavoprotein CzcO
MSTERFGVKPGQYIPGEVMHEYLEAYAREFGVVEHLRLSTKVVSAEHRGEGGWLLEIQSIESEQPQAPTRVVARRLIIATGQLSEPSMPHIQGQEEYDRPLFHSKDFQKYRDTVNTAKRVTVFGGTKSGWDAVYAYATHGVKVDWIIRRRYLQCNWHYAKLLRRPFELIMLLVLSHRPRSGLDVAVFRYTL